MQRIVAATCVMLALGVPERRVVIRTDSDGPLDRGAPVGITIELDESSHLLLVRIDTEGQARVLLPLQPWDDSTVAGTVAARFAADERGGIGYLLAIASESPFDRDELARDGHWDLHSLAGGRITGDPYAALSRFAARVAPAGRYDYDIAPYHVEQRHDYPRFVCYDCHSRAGPGWDSYGAACPRFSLVVYADSAHYPYRRYDRRAVLPTRPAMLAPRYEFRERKPTMPAILNRSRGPGERGVTEARPDRRRAEGPQDLRRRDPPSDTAEPAVPAQPRSLGEPELRRRRPQRHD
jgi:hypothetical protein